MNLKRMLEFFGRYPTLRALFAALLISGLLCVASMLRIILVSFQVSYAGEYALLSVLIALICAAAITTSDGVNKAFTNDANKLSGS